MEQNQGCTCVTKIKNAKWLTAVTMHITILDRQTVILYKISILFLCGSVVEHCVSSAKGCGFDSQGTHILMKMYNLNAIVSRFG